MAGEEFSEEQTVNRTWEWLRKNRWAIDDEEFERKAKEDFDRKLKS
jgi:hypothetical protein